MESLEIVLLVFLGFLILIIVFLIKFLIKKNKSTNLVNDESFRKLIEDFVELKSKNEDIDQIKEKVQNTNESIRQNHFRQMIDIKDIIEKMTKLGSLSSTQSEKTFELSKEIKIINGVFSSNYKRGELGEISLKWVLDECFNENEDIVIPQYTMKNGNRPDYFLKTSNGGIPIDSKFPFDNFLKVINLKSGSKEYKNEILILKKHLKKHIQDLNLKYLSDKDEVQQVFLYLPSEALFSFIHSKRDFSDIRKLALDKKVILTSSSNLPAALRIVSLFERDKKFQKKSKLIIEMFKGIFVETIRVQNRWDKIDKKLDTIVTDKKNYSISINKLTKKIDGVLNSNHKTLISKDIYKKEKINNINESE